MASWTRIDPALSLQPQGPAATVRKLQMRSQGSLGGSRGLMSAIKVWRATLLRQIHLFVFSHDFTLF